MNFRMLPLAVVAALATPGMVQAGHDYDEDENEDDAELPFSVAEVFFELNNSDGDLGIHALIDGEPWKRLIIEDPDERRILGVGLRSRLRRQGLTEFFFESAEPPFDELPPATFFARFPEGTYEIEGLTVDGNDLESDAEVTHVIPAPANPSVSGHPVALQCEDEEPGYDAPTITGDVIISWDPVTYTHPSLGNPQNAPILEVVNYEVVVEAEIELPNGNEFASVFSVILPPDVTEMTVPSVFLEQSDTFKYEVLTRESSWNQTAIESCFLLEKDD